MVLAMADVSGGNTYGGHRCWWGGGGWDDADGCGTPLVVVVAIIVVNIGVGVVVIVLSTLVVGAHRRCRCWWGLG